MAEINQKRLEDKKITDEHFGKGTFTQNRAIAKHYEKLGVPNQGRGNESKTKKEIVKKMKGRKEKKHEYE